MNSDKILISNFLREQSVLIIGADDILCETLTKIILDHCDLWHLYIILHNPESDKNVSKRNFLKNQAENRIISLNGNLSQLNLGLTHDQIIFLRENVSAVYYTGVTDYKATLKNAVEVNLLGTLQVLNFCHQIKSLKALIYVSTAFTCTDDTILDEVIYQQPISPEILIEYAKWMNDQQLHHVIKKFQVCLNGFVLSKNLSEELIDDEKNEFSVAIIRPSIVLEMSDALINLQKNYAVLKDDFPINPSTSLAVNLVPVNNLANLVLAVSWYLVVQRPHIPVIYHCTGKRNLSVKSDQTEPRNLFEKFYKLLKNWRQKYSKIDTVTLYKPFVKEFFRFEDTNRAQLKKLINDEDKAILDSDVSIIDYKFCKNKTEFRISSILHQRCNTLIKILLLLIWKKYILKSTPATHITFISCIVLYKLVEAGSKGLKKIQRNI